MSVDNLRPAPENLKEQMRKEEEAARRMREEVLEKHDGIARAAQLSVFKEALLQLTQEVQAVALRASDFELLTAIAEEKRATGSPVDAFVASRIDHLIGRLKKR